MVDSRWLTALEMDNIDVDGLDNWRLGDSNTSIFDFCVILTVAVILVCDIQGWSGSSPQG